MGTRFLFHLLSTNISVDSQDDDNRSGYDLSQKMSGHTLAICHLAGLIHWRGWSITGFREMYNQHPSEMRGVSAYSSINALCDFTFRSLNPQCSTILVILSVFSPDNTPQSIFELANNTDLPESLVFCSDSAR